MPLLLLRHAFPVDPAILLHSADPSRKLITLSYSWEVEAVHNITCFTKAYNHGHYRYLYIALISVINIADRSHNDQ